MERGGDTQSIVFESHWNNSAALASSRDKLASCIRITGTESASAAIRHISDCSIIYYLCRVELALPGGRHTFDLLTSASSTRSTCPRPPRGRSRRDLIPSPLPEPTEQPEAVYCVGDILFSFYLFVMEDVSL